MEDLEKNVEEKEKSVGKPTNLFRWEFKILELEKCEN
jgi:hypothetical protein